MLLIFRAQSSLLYPGGHCSEVYLLKNSVQKAQKQLNPLCLTVANSCAQSRIFLPGYSPGPLRTEALGLFAMATSLDKPPLPQPLFWQQGYGREILLLEYLDE